MGRQEAKSGAKSPSMTVPRVKNAKELQRFSLIHARDWFGTR